MKNPPHPGVGLASDLKAANLTVAVAAKRLKVSRQQLYKVINGQDRITAEMAVRLERVIGSTADHWLRLQSDYDLARAREKLEEPDITG